MYLLYFILSTAQNTQLTKFPTMSTFEVLKYNANFMRWGLGIRPFRFSEQINEFFQSFSSFFWLLVVFCYMLSSIAFVYKNWPQLEIIAASCIIVLGAVQTGGTFLSFGLKMEKVKMLHVKLQRIVDDEGK